MSSLGFSNRPPMHLLLRHLSVLYLLSVELAGHLDLTSHGVDGEWTALIAINDGEAHLITGWTICIVGHDLHTQRNTHLVKIKITTDSGMQHPRLRPSCLVSQ